MATFENEPLLDTGVPRLDESDFVAVDPSYLKVSLLGAGLFGVVAATVGVIVAILVPEDGWVPLVVAAALVAVACLFAFARTLDVRNMAYQVRTHDLSYRRGVVVRTVSTIPFVRVQHVRITHGPIERSFGLATVEVNSAGPDLKVAGLAEETAQWLKAVIIERAGDLTEEP